ncbi:MAG: glycosyltransferase family 4 protein [Muribaculaceae bacterium]|nr:glycosyltransferase family 4 protein [Muribaculaceae bacterium]
MNIIHIISNKEWGSSERYALDICRAMKALGHNVTIVCRNADSITSPLKSAAINYVTAPLKGSVDVISPVRVSKLLRGSSDTPTVIHVHDFRDAVIAARARMLDKNAAKTRIIITRHITSPAKKSVPASAIYADVDAILFPTRQSMELFTSTDPDIPHEKLHYIKPVTSRIDSHSAVQPVRDPDSFTLLFAGEITPSKGLYTLVRAMNSLKHRPIRLIVAGQGQGPVVMPVIREARSNGIIDRIDFKGAITVPDTLIDSADAIVIPDKSALLYDWMLSVPDAFGVRVIASDLIAHRSILPEGTLYFKPGDPLSLAQAIESAYTDRTDSRYTPSPDINAFDSYIASIQALYASVQG